MARNNMAQTSLAQGFPRILLAGALALTVNAAFGYALGRTPTAGERSYATATTTGALTAQAARVHCLKG